MDNRNNAYSGSNDNAEGEPNITQQNRGQRQDVAGREEKPTSSSPEKKSEDRSGKADNESASAGDEGGE